MPKPNKTARGAPNPNYSTSDSSLSGEDVTREMRPVNLFEFYKRINTPQRLAHMIVKFQDYIGPEEYEALLYFNPDEIPEEKAMLRPVRREKCKKVFLVKVPLILVQMHQIEKWVSNS